MESQIEWLVDFGSRLGADPALVREAHRYLIDRANYQRELLEAQGYCYDCRRLYHACECPHPTDCFCVECVPDPGVYLGDEPASPRF